MTTFDKEDIKQCKGKDRTWYILFLTITAVAMFSLLTMTPPTLMDDIIYRAVFQYDDNAPVRLIHSFGDIIDSQTVHYFTTNGRTLVHTILQTLLCLAHPMVFNVLNAIIFTLFIHFVTRLTGNKENRLLRAVTFTFLIFIVMVGFRTSSLWMPGAINYIWTAAATTGLMLWLRKIKDKQLTTKHILLSPMALLIGWTHEAFQLPLVIGLAFYIIINRHTILHRAILPYIIFHAIGTCLCVCSPAIIMRADGDGISLMTRLLYGCINFYSFVRVSWILLMVVFYMYIRRKQILYTHFSKYYWLYTTWIAAMGIVFLCGTTLERVAFAADLYAALLLLSLITVNNKKHARYAITIMSVIMITVYVPVTKLSAANYANYEYHKSQAEKDDAYIIKVRQLPESNRFLYSTLRERYIVPTIKFGINECYQAFDETDINNRIAAKLYGKKKLVYIPEDVAENIIKKPAFYKSYRLDSHEDVYVWELPNRITVKGVTFVLSKENMASLPLKSRLTLYKGDEYNLPNIKFRAVDIDGKTFLFFDKPTPNIYRRIKEVRLER